MEIDAAWEKIKKGLRDGATLSMEKIEEYTKIGKLKIEELAAKRKIDRNFVDIGERFFELISDGRGGEIGDDIVIKKAVSNVNELKADLASIEEKIKAVSEEAKASKGREDTDEEISGI